MTMNLGSAILIEAALSFLGLGINPPMASWGAMVSDGYNHLRTLPLLSIAPGVVIMIVVLAFNIAPPLRYVKEGHGAACFKV